jgi:DnaK suppressor protein
MTPLQRDQLRKELVDRLTSIYRAVRADLSDIIVDQALESDAVDEAEESAYDELRALSANLGDRDRRLAHSIEDALRRMRTNEDFGICIDCGCEIPFERLRAVPWTMRCAGDETRNEGYKPHATL